MCVCVGGGGGGGDVTVAVEWGVTPHLTPCVSKILKMLTQVFSDILNC